MHIHMENENKETIDKTDSTAGRASRSVPVSAPETAQCKFIAGSMQKHITRQFNHTGMPNHLKSGLESLSGFDMSSVRVHYNSPKPGKVGALAYAQGRHIHLGPGQEKHLPHEAWHVVQQMQGRVQPTVQYKGLALNDDTGLEKEADAMGEKLLRQYQYKPNYLRRRSLGKGSVMQRMPDKALASIHKYVLFGAADQALKIWKMLQNASSLFFRPYAMLSVSRNSIRRKLWLGVRRLCSLINNSVGKNVVSYRQFIALWNNGLKKTDPRYITAALIKIRKVSSLKNDESQEFRRINLLRKLKYKRPSSTTFGATSSAKRKKLITKEDAELDESFLTGGNTDTPGYIMPNKQWQELNQWYKVLIRDETMAPIEKIAELTRQCDLLNISLPEDFWVALKLFFVHTAVFSPIDNQGRDMTDKSTGGYYRTSSSVVKNLPKKIIVSSLAQQHPSENLSGKTLRALNVSLHNQLFSGGKLDTSFLKMSSYRIGEQDSLTFGIYTSTQSNHAGSLGFPSHAIKAMRLVERNTRKPQSIEFESTGSEIAELLGKIAPELLKPLSQENYHDFLLADRARLVREISDWIGKSVLMQGIKVQAIQSSEHPSIILYHPSASNSKNERAWREAMIENFNVAAQELGYQTRLNRRGSFGFLFPTASSVGGPVRIWPGLTPAAVFKAILKRALINVHAAQSKSPFKSPLTMSDMPNAKADITKAPVLHIEALKTAVRHTQWVLNHSKARPKGAELVYKWIVLQLFRHLKQAQYLLLVSGQTTNIGALENHFLKSALLIENLMEYTYLLQALIQSGNQQASDPYPNHLAATLAGSSTQPKKYFATYYLDSGMQAIVAANLLAKKQVESNKSSSSSARVLDINSYFEYATIHKPHLKLPKFDPSKDSGLPDIISEDLNPVLTSPGAQTINPIKALYYYRQSNRGNINQQIIPIIDITNSTLSKAAKLNLGQHYQNYIVLESLTKHQQLGTDKFTMGRLNVIGTPEFVKLAEAIVKPIADNAYDPLWMNYRLSMDNIFYGASHSQSKQLANTSVTFSPSPFVFKPLFNKGARKNQSQGYLYSIRNGVRSTFARIERGVFDQWWRGNSCGFLTLNTTREILQNDLMQTILQGTHQSLPRILNLIGDEIINSLISNQFISLSNINRFSIQNAQTSYYKAQADSGTAIQAAKRFLADNVNRAYANMDMSSNDAISYLNQYAPSDPAISLNKSLLIFNLQSAQLKYQTATSNINLISRHPQFILDYLKKNFLGHQQLGINSARAWAITQNIQLHIWTHAGGNNIQEISPQDVSPGTRVVHMLHTGNQTHFQELVLAGSLNLSQPNSINPQQPKLSLM